LKRGWGEGGGKVRSATGEKNEAQGSRDATGGAKAQRKIGGRGINAMPQTEGKRPDSGQKAFEVGNKPDLKAKGLGVEVRQVPKGREAQQKKIRDIRDTESDRGAPGETERKGRVEKVGGKQDWLAGEWG